jgi:hypothetical protein
MHLDRSRLCPCCRRTHIPKYQVVCGYCGPLIPFKIRADLTYAYRISGRNSVPYQEALISLWIWRNETDMGTYHREEDDE